MGGIFGKQSKQSASSQSQSTSSSVQDSRNWNNYWPQAQEDFGGVAQQSGQATNALSALLGLGGDPSAQQGAFENFRNNTGYQFGLNQGVNAITGSNAAKGLLNSGATAKAINQFGQDYASTKYNDYLSQLFNLSNQGLQAGQLLSGAGQESTSHGESQSQSTASSTSTGKGGKGGLGGLVGGALSTVAASDRRLKKDIKFIRTLPNGLNVYSYKYINDKGPYIGVMADEVERLVPEALGPMIDGYKTVDYRKIGVL